MLFNARDAELSGYKILKTLILRTADTGSSLHIFKNCSSLHSFHDNTVNLYFDSLSQLICECNIKHIIYYKIFSNIFFIEKNKENIYISPFSHANNSDISL